MKVFQVRLRKKEVRGGAKVVPLTLDQVNFLFPFARNFSFKDLSALVIIFFFLFTSLYMH